MKKIFENVSDGQGVVVDAERAARSLMLAATDARNTLGHGADHIVYAAREARELIAKEVARLTAASIRAKHTGSHFALKAAVAIVVAFALGFGACACLKFHQLAACGLLANAMPHATRLSI
jgi:UDP-N-acetylmuramyl pentapeptide synthase